MLTAVRSHPPGSCKRHKAHGYRRERERELNHMLLSQRKPVSKGHIPEIESQTMKLHPLNIQSEDVIHLDE